MKTILTTRVSTTTKIIIGVALGLGILGLGFAALPWFTNQSRQNNPTKYNQAYPVTQKNVEIQGKQEVAIFSQESTDVSIDSSLSQTSRNAQRRILSTDSLYAPLQPIINNGPIEEKYNFAFLAPTNFSDNEVAQIARLFYARGLQMYSPFREHWSVFNVYTVRVNQSDSGDDTYKENLVREFPYTQIQKVILLSKMDSQKAKKTAGGLSYAQMNGNVFMTFKYMSGELKKVFSPLKGFDFSEWSDSLDFNFWNYQQKEVFVYALIHELGHAIAGLADEYFYEGGKSELYPPKPNCLQEAPSFWQQNIGKQDTAYSQSGKVTENAGVFAGCSYSTANKRGTDNSVMTGRITYDPNDKIIIFHQFGYINRQALIEKFLGGKYKENSSPSCGGNDKGYSEPACGLTSIIPSGSTSTKVNGEECFPYYQVKKHKLIDGTTSNLCETCPKGTKYGPNGKCNNEITPPKIIVCSPGFEYDQTVKECKKYCGEKDQKICPYGVINTFAGCNSTKEPLVGYLGICKSCGQVDQPACPVENCRGIGLMVVNGFCKVCGGRGQRICSSGSQCQPPYKKDPWGASFCCSSEERFDYSRGPEGLCIPLPHITGPGSGFGPSSGGPSEPSFQAPRQEHNKPPALKRGRERNPSGGGVGG